LSSNQLLAVPLLYQQAINALSFGNRFDVNNHVFYYSKFQLTELIHQLSIYPHIQYCLHPGIQLLHEHDQKNNNELLRTLKTMLKNNLHHQKTATALNIHRSTLTYRIEQIKSILNIDWENNDTVIHLQLTLAVNDYLGTSLQDS
jgi:DNA-binding PucR family transcriptional regulator